MKVHLLKISGYEDAINALRMSTGKFYSWEKLKAIQDLVWLVTDKQGFLETPSGYFTKIPYFYEEGFDSPCMLPHSKITGVYSKDVAEFKRLLGLTKNQAMGENKHHTLMTYLDITFITEDMHRGAQDDLDAHAKAFDNRITRFSTRLAEIEDNHLSDWYKDKIIPIVEVDKYILDNHGFGLPQTFERDGQTFKKTPFGYVLEKYATVPAKNGLDKDVQRGGMFIGMASTAQWKCNMYALRYVYKMRSKFTKANPELKLAMEMLADEIEKSMPEFGQHFRLELTDTGEYEHLSKVKTVSRADFELLKRVKKEMREQE